MKKNKFIAWLLVLSVIFSLFSPNSTKAYAQQLGGAPEGYVTLSVEKFTLGQGYYQEPIKVPLYEGDNGASLIIRALGQGNIKNTGTPAEAFYLAKFKDPTQEANIPKYIVDQVEMDGGSIQTKRDPDWLGEFDYTSMSGWMYAVNNVFPNVGFSMYIPQDGDVIRTQFTVYGFGADLGPYSGNEYINPADKDTLTAAVAKINSAPDKEAILSDEAVNSVYKHAYELLENMETTQDSIDQAVADLDDVSGSDSIKPVLTIQGLTDQLETTNKQLSFQVSVKDNVTPNISPEVKLNGNKLSVTNGVYVATLNAGENTIIVSAVDASGNRVKQAFTVYYNIWNVVYEQLDNHLAYLVNTVTNPTFGTQGGEWSVLSLARANHKVPDGYYDLYYNNAVNKVKTLMTQNNGLLDKNKSTEHSRLILGLSAIGKDARKVAGYDITKALADYDYVLKQGINGPIFALIAMDTWNYDFPMAEAGHTQATREKLIDFILNSEIKKGTENAGGWALGSANPDVDITAMTLQALAPYYQSQAPVAAAVDRAVNWLSRVQNFSGGYSSLGSSNCESLAQVITALASLGIDPTSDPRFIKNGISAIDALLSFGLPGGGFKHLLTGKVDRIATDQGTYAMVAYKRMIWGQSRLYDMTDVIPQTPENPNGIEVRLPEGNQPNVVIPQDNHDYIIPISTGDSNKQITVEIPDASNAKTRLNLPAAGSLPQIVAVKGTVSAVIPQGAQIVSGDSSQLEWLTNMDTSDSGLQGQMNEIVPAGSKLDSIAKAITMGGNAGVRFSEYITLTFSGMKGKAAAYIQNGTAHPIQKYASNTEGSNSGSDEYAYDNGSDLIVKTKHFTNFVAYASSLKETPGNGGNNPNSPSKKQVTLSVDKATISKGFVLNPVSVELLPSDTVWSVFQRELNAKGIPYKYEWNAQYGSVYVQSINGDGEFDHGTGSGWMYNVNGIYPNYGASQYVLKAGDTIQWRYTTNLGADLGQNPNDWDSPENGTLPNKPTDNAAGNETPAIHPNDKTPVIAVPKDIQKDYVFSITKQLNNTDNITFDIPNLQPKVILNLEAVKDSMPKITANKEGLSLVIDKGTQLKSGDSSIQIFTAADSGDAKLQGLVKGSLGAKDQLKQINRIFIMGAANQSVLFDSPLP